MRDPFKQARDVPTVTPSIVLINPKYPHNVGAVVRACSCFGITQIRLTGDRVVEEVRAAARIPREERMRDYQEVSMVMDERPLSRLPEGATPVAIELVPGAENLMEFEHPPNPVYVFGPEDGSIPQQVMRLCHRRVFLPTRHCINLSAAVYLIMYDRMIKQFQAGEIKAKTITECLAPNRGRQEACG